MSDYCLVCSEYIVPKITWSIFWGKNEIEYLCLECQKKLSKITGQTCEKCCRQLENLASEYIQNNTCLDCIKWENDSKWSGVLERNLSVYNYNDFFKELLARFKFRGDYILAKAFAQDIHNILKQINYDIINPIPLSEERFLERGFSQAEALVVESGLQPSNLLTRIHTEKQSKKSRHERIHLPNVFEVLNEELIKDKTILLFDDIYTTGSTIRHAAQTLKNAGAKSVVSFTVARG